MNWIQTTIIKREDGIETPYPPKERSEHKMIELLLQGHFLKQAGENIEYDAKANDNFEWVEIKMIRKMKDRTVIHIYKKEEEK